MILFADTSALIALLTCDSFIERACEVIGK
jgi:hypothetical protein